jgi:serine/threonine protein kinase
MARITLPWSSVEGLSLDRKIDGHPVRVPELLDIAIQIADALDEAHAKGITHRESNPPNIVISSRVAGRKVLVLCLAKFSSRRV